MCHTGIDDPIETKQRSDNFRKFLSVAGDISAEELFNMFFGGAFPTGKWAVLLNSRKSFSQIGLPSIVSECHV